MTKDDLQSINPGLSPERRAAILAGVRAWIADYNARAKLDYQFAGDRAHLATALAARCLQADLDPLAERITARPQYDKKAGAWGLVFIAEIETLLSRASRTGRYVSHRTYTRIREDKRLLAVAEVAHLYLPPVSVAEVAPSIVVSSDEGDVGEWKAMVGGSSSFWSANPTHMAANAMLRAVLKRAFPDLLSGADEMDDGDDGAYTDDTHAAPTPAQREAAREAATSPAGATPAQAAGAAKAALRGERARVREPDAPRAAAPSDIHARLLALAPGFSAEDLEDLARRGFSADVASLTDAQVQQLETRILPRGMVTAAQRADLERERAAFLSEGGDAGAWQDFCRRATGNPAFLWHPAWVKAADALMILAPPQAA